tara:strand:+ start:1953 stop:2225 length:273 start_codon:yes stop_codon:yes gene_type:complete
MANLDDLRKASSNAAQRTDKILEAKITNLTTENISQLILELKATVVSAEEIEIINKQITAATDKNKKILDIVDKGGDVAKVIIGILGKIV